MRPLPLPVRRLFTISVVMYTLLTILMVVLTPSLTQRFYPLPVDQGPAWYYWQTGGFDQLGRISYWVGYLLHQVSVFYLLYRYRKQKQQENKGGLNRYNALILAVNGLFVLLHIIQTQLWYDGLAKDVPIWTSQGSVIVMLVLILYLMIPVRGLFWGKAFRPPETMLGLIRRYHGVFISWALVYTFWFHPSEGNWGLASGFVYMFLLFIQMNMIGTALHVRKGWVVLLEAFVTVHGTLITVYKENPIWPMFLFGFAAMFVFTQVHSWKLSGRLKVLVLLTYILSVLGVYGFIRGFEHIYEITFIPVALYGGALALLALGWLIERIKARRGT